MSSLSSLAKNAAFDHAMVGDEKHADVTTLTVLHEEIDRIALERTKTISEIFDAKGWEYDKEQVGWIQLFQLVNEFGFNLLTTLELYALRGALLEICDDPEEVASVLLLEDVNLVAQLIDQLVAGRVDQLRAEAEKVLGTPSNPIGDDVFDLPVRGEIYRDLIGVIYGERS